MGLRFAQISYLYVDIYFHNLNLIFNHPDAKYLLLTLSFLAPQLFFSPKSAFSPPILLRTMAESQSILTRYYVVSKSLLRAVLTLVYSSPMTCTVVKTLMVETSSKSPSTYYSRQISSPHVAVLSSPTTTIRQSS